MTLPPPFEGPASKQGPELSVSGSRGSGGVILAFFASLFCRSKSHSPVLIKRLRRLRFFSVFMFRHFFSESV